MKTKAEPDYIRHDWLARTAHWRAREYGAEIRCTTEWWAFEYEAFDGAWMLEESGRCLHAGARAQCFARMLVALVAGRAVRQDVRSEDLADDITSANAYLDALKLAPIDVWSAKRVLAVLQPFDPAALADELLRMAFTAACDGFELSARSLAQIAYDAASAHACHNAARTAALTLSRLAELQECPRTARRWRGIAHLHGRRAEAPPPAEAIDG